MYLVTASEMQQIDRRTIEDFGIPGMVLMENAGRAATRFLLEQFPDLKNQRVGVIAGRGNNGGDGFVIARYLKQKGIQVYVYLLADSSKVQGDAAANLRFLQPLDIPLLEVPDEASFSRIKSDFAGLDVWVDALLGTGLKSDLKLSRQHLLLDADADFLWGAFIYLGDSIGIDRLQVEHGGVDVGCLGFQILGGLFFFVDLPIQHPAWTPS